MLCRQNILHAHEAFLFCKSKGLTNKAVYLKNAGNEKNAFTKKYS